MTTPTHYDVSSMSSSKPEPHDMSHHYSDVTKHRLPSKIKEYYRFFRIPGIGNIAGGLPNVQFFPFDTLEAQAAKPERWTPSPDHPDDSDNSLASKLALSSVSSDPSAATHIGVPKAVEEIDPVKKIDLTTALQYGTAQGYPPLWSWVRQFTREHLHPNVPYKGGPDVILTCGSTDGFSKTIEMFINPWIPGKDDIRDQPGILCETFVYPGVLSQSIPKGVEFIPVKADEGGMVVDGPGGLVDILANWDDAKGKRPNLMYTVTMGHNPTGIILSLERRKEIYAACSKYDVIIVEDDPYWYLQYPSADIEERKSRDLPPLARKQAVPGCRSSGYNFLDSLVPSFLSVDIDGRVIRLDTFSKTIAPGCRLGWITAQPDLIERFLRITEVSTQQPSGFVQSMVAELVMGPQPEPAKKAFALLRTQRERATFTGWQMDGWVRWLSGLRGAYERRMNRMCRILDEGSYQLKTGTTVRAADADWGVVTKTQLLDFVWPRGGMFVWIRVNFPLHPLWQAKGSAGDIVDGTVLATALMVFLTTKPYLVLVSPGMMFSATEHIRRELGFSYFRVCFAAETEENVDACSHRFVAGLQRFWRIKKVGELKDILKDNQWSVNGDGTMTAQELSDDLGNLGSWLGC